MAESESFEMPNKDEGKLLKLDHSPFTENIMKAKVPQEFKMPPMKAYDGLGDPIEHANTYDSFMEMYRYSDAIKCRAFSLTLTGLARSWYRRLNNGSISSFEELAEAFVVQFCNRLPRSMLLTISQREGESLEDYIRRFSDRLLQVVKVPEGIICGAFILGLHDHRLLESVEKDRINFGMLLQQVRKNEAKLEKESEVEIKALEE